MLRVVCTFLLCSAAWGQLHVPQQDVVLPLPASLSPADYDWMQSHTQLTIPDFALPDGRNVTLSLQRREIFSDTAELVSVDADGSHVMPRPELRVFHGTVVDTGDRVVLGISPTSLHGLIRGNKGDLILSSGRPGADLPTVIFDPRDVPGHWIAHDPFTCHYDAVATPTQNAAQAPAGGLRSNPCRIADIALETDYEYRQLFASDAEATAYAGTLLAALSEIFQTDANLTLEIVYLRLWNTTSDPWSSGTSMNARLVEFRDYWNLNMTGVTRNAAHLLSGQTDDDGIAYGDAACLAGFDYAVSSGLDGTFPYPLIDNDSDNWDLYITAHEFGHNFGNPHTHAIGIDDCANFDCSVTPNGTLMSYCNQCPGGVANIVLNFHPTMISTELLPFLGSGQCALDANTPTLLDEPNSVTVCGGNDLVLNAAWSSTGTTTAQWRKDGVDLPGENGPTLTIVSPLPTDSGDYDVVVSNACGSVTSATATVVICRVRTADLNDDCVVDLTDLANLLANFGKMNVLPEQGDINLDNQVDLTDLAELLAQFGRGC